jgi:hypothetical protein
MGDTLVEASYGLQPLSDSRGRWRVPFWGGAGLSLRSVIRRQHDLGLGLRLLDKGVSSHADFTTYLRRTTGLTVSLRYTHQERYDSVGGELGFIYYPKRRLGATLSFAPAWNREISQGVEITTVDCFFQLTLFSRL